MSAANVVSSMLSRLNDSSDSSGGKNSSALSLSYHLLNSNKSTMTMYITSKLGFINFSDLVFLLIYALIFVVGLVGNFIVIYFVLVYKRMQTMTNKLITNLSIADLLVIFFCVPVTASGCLSSNWLFGELVCKASGFTQGICLANLVMKKS